MVPKMKFYKKSDMIVILSILVVCLAVWGAYKWNYSKQNAKAEIYYGSDLVQTIDLNTGVDRRFSIPQDDHVVFHLYSNGSIGFESSDCPDKICIRSGRLSKVGESAACLPNKIILKIVPDDGYDDNDLDIIV